MTTAIGIPASITGAERREVFRRMKENDRLERRDSNRRPSPHAIIIRELKRAQLLPAPGVDLTEDERRRVRNKLKAMRRAR